MSTTIDERVVEMRFDNKQFESNVKTSMSTLDKLKQSLNLDSAAKSLSGLTTAAKKCDFSTLSNSVETVSAKFSALEVVAMSALSNITNSAVNAGKQLLSSLTVDQISAGWEKFGSKTTSVGTLVSQGYDIDTVTEQLERLNWYTDETSYNFTDMVSNIAKFTASGQDLETSVTAMEGIANWAALSGQNATTASQAMYQLSQAMSAGYMRLEDYKSIQNASMDTAEFRQKCLDAAVALGTLKENADGTYSSLVASTDAFTLSSFTSSLTEGAWMTSDVMMSVFNDYSNAVDQIYEYAEENGVTASEAIEALGDSVDEFGLKAFLAAQEARTFSDVIDSVKDAVSTGWMNTFELIFGNYEEATELWTDLANAMYDVFAEGGNARNEMLEEAMATSGWDRFTDVLEEAGVSLETYEQKLSETAQNSGLSLESIISEAGSLEEAVQQGLISTDLLMAAVGSSAEALSAEELAALNTALEDVIDGIDQISGREHLISAFWNTWEGVGAVLSNVSEAFRDIFPAMTSEQLYGFLEKLDDATERFRSFVTESEEGQQIMSDLRSTFRGLFAVLDIVKQAFVGLFDAFSPLGSASGDLLTNILGLTGSFGEWLVSIDESMKQGGKFATVCQTISDYLEIVIAKVKEIAPVVKEAFLEMVDRIKEVIDRVKEFAPVVKDAFGKFADYLETAIEKVKAFAPSVQAAFEKIADYLEPVKTKLTDFITSVKENFKMPGFDTLHSLLERLQTRMSQVMEALGNMKAGILEFSSSISSSLSGNKGLQAMQTLFSGIKTVASSIISLFGKIGSAIAEAFGGADFSTGLDLLNGISFAAIAAGVQQFVGSFKDAVDEIGDIKDSLTGILDGVKGCFEAWQNEINAKALLKIASAIAILAAALVVLSLIDSEKLNAALIAVGGLFTELIASMTVMNKVDLDGKGLSSMGNAMIKMSASLLIMASALKTIAELEPEQLAVGLTGVGVLLAEIDVFLNTVKFDSKASSTATGMLIFAAAIKVLASAVTTMADLDWTQLAKGLTGVGVLLAEIDVFLNTAKFSGSSLTTAAGIVVLAAAIKVLASACQDFAEMSWEELSKGLASVGALLLEITAFTNLTGSASNMVSSGLGMIEIAAAMKIFASAMEDFADMQWEEIAKGLTAMGGALLEVAVAVKLMPSNMVTMGTGLVLVGAALEIVANALGNMGGMSWEEIGKGLVTMGGALAELAIGLNLMNGTLAGSAAMLVAAAALAVLTPVLFTLGSMSWESIAKGLITLAGAFTVMGVAGAVLSGLAPTIVALSASLVLMGVGIVGLGAGLLLIGTGLAAVATGITALATSLGAGVTVIVAGLTAVITGIAALIPAIATQLGQAVVAFANVITEGAPAIGEAVKALVLTMTDVLVECVPEIADAALELVAGVLDALVTYAPQIIDSIMALLTEVIEGLGRNLPSLIQAVVDLVSQLFSGVIEALGSLDSETLLETVAGVGLLTGIMAALGALSGMVTSAMTGVLGLGAVIAELAVVLAAIGALAQIPGLEWLISEGGQLMASIGDAIGGFVGAIVGGFLNGVSSSFPQIGADLGAFMTNVQPFIDGASSIDASMLTGVAALTAAIMMITAADLLEGLTSWLTGGSSLADFAEELVPFGEAMMKFSDTISGLDSNLVNEAAIAGKTLAEMADTLPNSGGLAGLFAGNNDMDEFGEQLVVFGDAMMEFADSVDGLDADTVTNAATAGKAMAEMANTLPNTGGAVSFFTGNNDMDAFAEQLVPFGEAIKEYSDAVTGLDADAVTNSATAGKAMVELADTLPNTGGAVSFFTGNNDMDDFGAQLISFGGAIKIYADTVTGLDSNAVENSALAGKTLAELADVLPNTGGLVSLFTGSADFEDFGDQIVPFGQAMRAYSDSVTGMDANAVTASTVAAQALAELQATLPTTGGVVDFFTGSNDFASFAEGLIPFGSAMKIYSDTIADMNVEAVTSSVIAAQALAELQNALPNVGGVVDFFTGGNDLETFGTSIVAFGRAMKAYSKTVTGMEVEAVTASAVAAQSLIELQNSLGDVGGVVDFFTGGNDLGKFAEGIVPFGEAMKYYGEAVADINADAITASAVAAQSLSTLQADLPNVGGVMEFFSGGNDLDKFADGIIPFGWAMKSYGDAVADINVGTIQASVVAAQSLSSLQADLPNVGGAVSFFTGGNDLATFAEGIVLFGAAMKSYGEAIADIDSDAVKASATAAQSLAKLQSSLPNVGGVVSFFTGGKDLEGFAAELVPFGEAMKEYGDAVAGMDADAVASSATAGQALAELANTLPKCGGLVSFFTGSTSFSVFGEDLIDFGENLAAYSDAVKDVQADTVTASANAAMALANLAEGLPDSSVFDQWFNTDQGLTAFGKDLVDFGGSIKDYYSSISGISTDKMEKVVTAIWSMVELAEAASAVNSSGLSSFADAMQDIGKTGVSAFANAFSNSESTMDKAVVSMLSSISSSLTSNMSMTNSAMESVVKSMANIVTAKATVIQKAISSMMSNMYTAIKSASSSVSAALSSVLTSAVSSANGLVSQFTTLGKNVGAGFVSGIKSQLSSASSAGRSLGLAALNAAKTALDSHSPSREFIYLGENIGEGLAIGVNNSIVPASQAVSTMIDEVIAVSNKGIEAFEEWVEEKQYYDELSLMDELAGWENLQKKYVEGSEERIQIDREVYRVQNELVAATYQASIDWIEEKKYYNEMSTEQELAAYEAMQSRYLEGSEERMEIDKKVYELRNQLVDESYQNSMDWIEEELYYERMSLAEELAAYKRVQSRYEKGTDERKEMDQEVYRVEKEIYEAQQQYIADVQSAQEEANEKRIELEEEYAEKVKSINEQLESDIESLNETYEDAVESRANTLYSAYGLFDSVSEKEAVSGDTLITNLEDQVKEFNKWADLLDQLADRGVDADLISELQEMGPTAVAEIEAINNMSDDELDKYVSLWSVKHALAREQATSELEDLRIETQEQIAQLRIDAEEELDEYRETWLEEMDQLEADLSDELAELRQTFAETVGLIETDTETEMAEMAAAAQEILTAAGWDETGQQIVNGLVSGISSQSEAFLTELTNLALAGVEAVQSTLDINSPSRVFERLGSYTGLGFVNGLADYVDKTYDTGEEMADAASSGLSDAMAAISALLDSDLETQPTIRPVLDLSDVTSNISTLDSLFSPQRSIGLAGQASLAFDGTTENSGLTVSVDNDSVVQELRSLREEMSEMTQRMERVQVVMDTGALVGAMTDPMDSALGQKQNYRGRGI